MVLPRRDIELNTCDGTVLRGWHYPTEKLSPCIIMSYGLAGIRHFVFPRFAERLQEAGFGVLLYDNRYWGDNEEGIPRQILNTSLQQMDYFDAFNFATTLPGVDPERITFWGTNLSGDNVIFAAAVDERIKAAVVQCPAVSRETRSSQCQDRAPALCADRARIVQSEPGGRLPTINPDLESAKTRSALALFPDLDSYRSFDSIDECRGRWEGKLGD